VAPEEEQPRWASAPRKERAAKEHDMKTIANDWDVGSVVTLIWGAIATLGLIAALLWTWLRG